MSADAAELMHPDEPAEHRIVLDAHVTGELRVIRKGRPVANHAVVRNMRVRQQPVTVAEGSDTAILGRAGVDRQAEPLNRGRMRLGR